MLDSILTWLTVTVGGRMETAVLAAAGWGVASVLLSPCHLSSIPLVIGYLTGQGTRGMTRSLSMSFLFGVGNLITIGLVGAGTAAAGRMMGDLGTAGHVLVVGIFLVVGLSLLDLLRLPWDGPRPRASSARGWSGALLLGLLFGLGLGPCTFAYLAPVLGVVLGAATTDMAKALALVSAFALGHCAVLVAAGTAADRVQEYLHWTERSRGATHLKRAAGVLVLAGGAYYVFTLF